MTIISSQHYIDWDLVTRKMDELEGQQRIVIPCSYVGVIDGTEYALQLDGHHALAAARELGLEIEYEIGEDSEGLTGDALLNARYIDGDFYKVEESNPAYDKIVLVW